MDHGAFDALTRAVADGAGPRRAVVRLLTGGALAGLAAHLGLGEVTQAKSKKHGKPRGDKKLSGELHAAGKKHKKHKKKDKDKPKKPKDRKGKLCGDGTCAAANECCPFRMVCDTCEEAVCVNGEWECRENCPGQGDICCDGTCVGPCGDGRVRNPETCQCDCPEGQWLCPNDVCWPIEECCPGSQRCSPTSCSEPGKCCNGQQQCPDGETCAAEGECCPEQKRCGGECIPDTVCCEDDPQPLCDRCQVLACDGGAWTCHGTRVQCQEGCCPEGYGCHHLGSCCVYEPTLFCTCPSGYHSEAGLCVPD
jgi:hypothetical protein